MRCPFQNESERAFRNLFEEAERLCRVDGRILFRGPDILGMPVLAFLVERSRPCPHPT